MRHVMIKSKEKRRKVFMITGVTATLVILGIIAYISYKQYDSKIPETRKDENDRREEFMKFEELYKSIETELNEVVEELKNEGLYELNSSGYAVYFKENAINRKENPGIILCYFDGDELKGKEESKKELISLNNNESLKKLLKKIQEKGIVRGIIIRDLTKDIREISFEIDTKYTSFVKDNNGITNSVVYCEDEDCQRYGYYKIRENWYLRIPPRPE